jgi:ribonuclease-3 family protein
LIYCNGDNISEREETVMHDKISGASLPSSAALAYIGDARHALYVRRMLVLRGITKAGELNELSLAYVTAEAQARAYAAIEDRLLDDEREVFRRAFNSTHLNKPKRASGKDYRTATGFEAVIGMLEWIGDTERIDELLSICCENTIGGNDNDTEN